MTGHGPAWPEMGHVPPRVPARSRRVTRSPAEVGAPQLHARLIAVSAHAASSEELSTTMTGRRRTGALSAAPRRVSRRVQCVGMMWGILMVMPAALTGHGAVEGTAQEAGNGQ